MYGCENWIIKKAERRRIDAFELWCWRRLLRVPWTARRSNKPILKEISPEYSLEGLMLKLKLQYFGHLMRRTGSFEKTLMLGKIEGGRRRVRKRMRRLDDINDSMDVSGWTPGAGDGQGGLACCDSWGRKESDMTERLNWTELLASLGIPFVFVVQLPSLVGLFASPCQAVDCGMPSLPIPHSLLEFAQVTVHCISDAVQPSHPLTTSSPSLLDLS